MLFILKFKQLKNSQKGNLKKWIIKVGKSWKITEGNYLGDGI